jgi:hypothetical protein
MSLASSVIKRRFMCKMPDISRRLAQEYRIGHALNLPICGMVITDKTATGTVPGLSDSKVVILGIAIGYPGWDAPVKQFRSERGPRIR